MLDSPEMPTTVWRVHLTLISVAARIAVEDVYRDGMEDAV